MIIDATDAVTVGATTALTSPAVWTTVERSGWPVFCATLDRADAGASPIVLMFRQGHLIKTISRDTDGNSVIHSRELVTDRLSVDQLLSQLHYPAMPDRDFIPDCVMRAECGLCGREGLLDIVSDVPEDTVRVQETLAAANWTGGVSTFDSVIDLCPECSVVSDMTFNGGLQIVVSRVIRRCRDLHVRR